MNAAMAACAASGLEVARHGIDWAECYRQVRRLQARIVKAVQIAESQALCHRLPQGGFEEA